MTQTAQKQVDIRYIVTLKSNGYRVYVLKSSDGTKDYHVTVSAGTVRGCDCLGFFYRHTCSHSRYVRGLEEARMEREAERAEFNAKVQAEAAAWEAEAARYRAEKEQREMAAYDARRAARGPQGTLNGNREVRRERGIPMR